MSLIYFYTNNLKNSFCVLIVYTSMTKALSGLLLFFVLRNHRGKNNCASCYQDIKQRSNYYNKKIQDHPQRRGFGLRGQH